MLELIGHIAFFPFSMRRGPSQWTILTALWQESPARLSIGKRRADITCFEIRDVTDESRLVEPCRNGEKRRDFSH